MISTIVKVDWQRSIIEYFDYESRSQALDFLGELAIVGRIASQTNVFDCSTREQAGQIFGITIGENDGVVETPLLTYEIYPR